MSRQLDNAARPLPEEETVRYRIDITGSSFAVKATSTGMLSAFGHDPRIAIRDFGGEVEFSPGGSSLDDARVQLNIRADSLEVTDDVNEKDRADIQRRMQDEVIDIEHYPDILYECSRVTGSGNGASYWLALNGELTLCGMTRPVLVQARIIVTDASIRASGEFLVRQSAFGIAPVTAVGGAIRLKDELKCNFDIVARKVVATHES